MLDPLLGLRASQRGAVGPHVGGPRSARLFTVCVLACFGAASCRSSAAEDAQVGAPDACTTGCSDGGGRADAGTQDGGNQARDGAVGDGGSADAGLACTPFPSFRRDCETLADCALGVRTYNCCGSQLVTGVRADQLDAFNRAAQHCDSLFPACGCPSQATRADDGTVDDLSDWEPSVTCQNHQCWSSFGTFSGRTPCGSQDASCDAATEICRTTSGAGASAPSACVPVPSACATNRTCDCLGKDLCSGATSECFDDPFANAITCACTQCQ
jgi:hypothetical protein